MTQFALAWTLKDGGGTHERSDEEDGEPQGDEDIIHDQGDGGSGLETNEAVLVFVQDGDSIEDHEGQDESVWSQEYDVGTIELKGERESNWAW